jgi:lia operon protein LiaF
MIPRSSTSQKNGIGSVKIDLGQAQIPDGEHHVRAESWIGDVDVWVPPDLAFSATGRVVVGNLRMLDRRDDGVMLERTVTSANYDVAPRRVRIEASLIIGDVRIRLA